MVGDVLTSEANWAPLEGSPASMELAHRETGPQGEWGAAPVLGCYAVAGVYIKSAAEYLKAAESALPSSLTSLPIEIFARTALETSSISRWLLEDGLGARRRVSRMFLIRLHGATELGKAVQELGVENDGARLGENVDQVIGAASKLGLELQLTELSAKCEGEVLPGPTTRAADLLSYWDSRGFEGGPADAILCAHWANSKALFSVLDGQGVDHRTAMDVKALHGAVYAALLALIDPLERAGVLFGWKPGIPGPGAMLSDAIDRLNIEMSQLRALAS